MALALGVWGLLFEGLSLQVLFCCRFFSGCGVFFQRFWVVVGVALSVVGMNTAAASSLPSVDEAVYQEIIDKDFISKDDIKVYKHAFEALEKQNFGEVDDILDDIDNDLLKGHVLAEKYLSKSYKSTYEELNAWLESYYDLPQAGRIFRLAERKAKNVAPSSVPEVGAYERPLLNYAAYAKLSQANKKYLQQQLKRFFTSLNRGKTRTARAVLETKKFRMIIPDGYWDELAQKLALVYLLDNYNKLAYEWSLKPARRSHLVMAYWVAGLAAWRMKNYQNAENYFAKLSQVKNNDEWLVSAGGYWAYRAAMRLNKPKQAEKYLKSAAKYKRTFYGMLAAYTLGEKIDCTWDKVAYLNDFSTNAYVQDLVSSPAVVRAVALFHAKRPDLAEDELMRIYSQLTLAQKESILFLAEENNRHALAIRISQDLRNYDKNVFYDGLAYPLPELAPADGWQANKALLYALMRQESSFDPEAVSPSGACGLMQLLPSTAAYITKDNLKSSKSKLFETDYNLYAGQKYVNYLLNKDYINGDLFLMMTAYNAGPGNLQKWRKKMKYNNDPLLFIELIPARQTRIYVERVMANFWLYSLRMEEFPDSLEQLKSGQWPVAVQGKDYR